MSRHRAQPFSVGQQESDDEACLNLDYFKWMMSYAWNLGVQCFHREGDKDQAKRYFQFSSQLLLQVQKLLSERLSPSSGCSYQEKQTWQQLKLYIDVIGPRIEQVHQKVLYELF